MSVLVQLDQQAAALAGDQDRPGPPVPAETAPPAPDEGESGDEPLAKVIPMKIFDPFTEADKRW